MSVSRLVVLGVLVATAWPGVSGGQEPKGAGADPIAERLFPPELVLRHQQSIGLTDGQRQAMMKEMEALQSDVIKLQFQLQAATEKLILLLERPRLDEASVLGAADAVMQFEQKVKRRHLQFLVRLKNLLTPQQHARLQQLRRERP
jgi:Spy/CpxP family protein refolding chaperone